MIKNIIFKIVYNVTIFAHFCLSRLCAACILAVRPLLGPSSCRFDTGCTTYALDQLKKQPFHLALWHIVKRLLSCNPFW